jgi:diguanylate cyclase (GGDEF)-like protein
VIEAHTVASVAAARTVIEAWRSRALFDRLTGLGNLVSLVDELVRLASLESNFALGYVDLDGLKSINDSEGHEAGDALIQDFAARLRFALVEVGGKAFRRGGDEFVVSAQVEANVLEEALEMLGAGTDVAPFSFGVAVWPTDGDDVQAVERVADTRMYKMKELKRST